MVVVRFYVGENEANALVRLNQKLASNADRIPPGVIGPLVKPRSIDDVPIMAVTLWGERYDDHTLRLFAAELAGRIKEVPDVSEVTLIGGRPRQVSVELDPQRLAAYDVDPAARAAGHPGRERAHRSAETRSKAVARRRCARAAGSKPPTISAASSSARIADARSSSATSPPSSTATPGPRATSASTPRRPHVSSRHHRHRQAQGHQRHRRRAPHRAEARAPQGHGRAGRPPAVDHAQLRRDGGREIERAAVAHAARRHLGVAPHLAGARQARGRGRPAGHAGDARPHALHLLPLRLHAEPHHALRPDLLHRHPRGRCDCGRGEHRAACAAVDGRTGRPGGDRDPRRRRGRQPDDPRDADGHRRDPADGVRRRPDGALHAADSRRRLGGHGVLARRRVHRHALGGGSPAAAARRGGPRSRRSPDPALPARHEAAAPEPAPPLAVPGRRRRPAARRASRSCRSGSCT